MSSEDIHYPRAVRNWPEKVLAWKISIAAVLEQEGMLPESGTDGPPDLHVYLWTLCRGLSAASPANVTRKLPRFAAPEDAPIVKLSRQYILTPTVIWAYEEDYSEDTAIVATTRDRDSRSHRQAVCLGLACSVKECVAWTADPLSRSFSRGGRGVWLHSLMHVARIIDLTDPKRKWCRYDHGRLGYNRPRKSTLFHMKAAKKRPKLRRETRSKVAYLSGSIARIATRYAIRYGLHESSQYQGNDKPWNVVMSDVGGIIYDTSRFTSLDCKNCKISWRRKLFWRHSHPPVHV